MKSTFIRKIVTLAVAGASLSATSVLAQKGADAFNRPTLSTTWVVTAGSLSISNKQLVGSSESLGYLKSLTANSATAATAVLFTNGTDLEYGAVAVGNVAGGNNAFVKLQSQNGVGSFDHGAFYTGNNGGGNFFTLSTPVPSPAILDVFFCGTTAHMRITSAAGIQNYTNDYGTTFGVGGGLGTYGSISIDNFDGFASGCNDAEEHATPAALMPHDIDLTIAK